MSLDAKARAGSRLTLQDQVLDLLKKAGARGCTGEELSSITWRFGACLFELRKKGWTITTQDRPGTDVPLYLLTPGTVTPSKQVDLMRQGAPARPSAGPVVGFCKCGHLAAQHRPGGGRCFDCDCQGFHSQE